jgi:hypothetical protein
LWSSAQVPSDDWEAVSMVAKRIADEGFEEDEQEF